MPILYAPIPGADQSDEHKVDHGRSRQDSRALHSKPSTASVKEGFQHAWSFISPGRRSSNRDLRASIPSEQVPGQENDFQDVNDNTQSPNGPRADRTRSSTFGRLRERVSRKNIRAQNGNDMPSAPDSNLRPQPSRDSLRPVPMERSYGQSGWRRLTNQLSLPNLRSAAKRKLSEYQAGQQDRDQAYAGSSFRIKRLTVAHPPVFTYQEYQRSLQNVHGLNPFRDELGRAIPVSAQATQDVEMLDACVAGPSSPRNLYSNEDALAALEGRAPHDDGRNWDRDRHIDELAGQWPLKQYTRTREATHDSLGSPGDLVEVLADASDLPVFDNKQQRRFSRYIAEADDPNGFEYEL